MAKNSPQKNLVQNAAQMGRNGRVWSKLIGLIMSRNGPKMTKVSEIICQVGVPKSPSLRRDSREARLCRIFPHQLANLLTEINALQSTTDHHRAIRREWYIILLIFYEAVVIKVADVGEAIAHLFGL